MYATALKLAFKYRKYLIAVVVVVGIFVAGWQVNGWRLNAQFEGERADREAIIVDELAKREAVFAAKLKFQQVKAQQAAVQLEESLTTLREDYRETITLLDTAKLVKPEVINCEIPTARQNPFSTDFVRLWNDSMRD